MLPEVCAEALKGPSDNRDRKVLISRHKAVGRHIANEPELQAELDHRGFEMICLEDLQLDDQIRLFGSADTVVASHGAGLTNMLFSLRCRVIELAGSAWNPSFHTLPRSLNHDYALVHAPDVSIGRRSDIVAPISAVLGQLAGPGEDRDQVREDN